MKKLKFIPGGQPFRSTDFELIQNGIINSIRELFQGITADPVILSGVTHPDLDGYTSESPFTVTAGAIYDLYEICRVPTATFLYDGTKSLYLRRGEIESSERTIAGSPQNVMLEVVYNLVYATAAVTGDIALSNMSRLRIITGDSFVMKQETHYVELESGFTASTGSGLYCFMNDSGERMIVCYFSATTPTGTIAALPSEMCPGFDTVGWYDANGTIKKLVIRPDGDVQVSGAATTGNVIMFRYSGEVEMSL